MLVPCISPRSLDLLDFAPDAITWRCPRMSSNVTEQSFQLVFVDKKKTIKNQRQVKQFSSRYIRQTAVTQ